MNRKEYKIYLKNKEAHIENIRNHMGMTKYIKKLNNKFYEPFLKQISATFKAKGIYDLGIWHLYPSSGFAMHKTTFKKIPLFEFIEKYINPDKKVVKEESYSITMLLYCCKCKEKVWATQIRIKNKIFYKCDCGLKVKTDNNEDFPQPLGNICSQKLNNEKTKIDKLIDSFCKKNEKKMVKLYNHIQDTFKSKRDYATGQIKNIEGARKIYKIIKEFIAKQNLISKRTKKGLESARARGRCGGRPKTALTDEKIKMAKLLHKDKTIKIKDICETLQVSRKSLYRMLKFTNKQLKEKK